jgi:16S rRNA (guanine966-N2)-methyltransferase
MRVIAGALGGRLFDSPHSHRTHPMSDKMRGALFNALGDIGDLTVLDAFAGSGALSFEAVSRGAYSSLALEADIAAQKVIIANVQRLGLGRAVKLIKANAGSWLQTTPDDVFDIVLCDPPYENLQLNLVQRLAQRVKPGGVLVLSAPGDLEPPTFVGSEQLLQRDYGDAQLIFYRA